MKSEYRRHRSGPVASVVRGRRLYKRCCVCVFVCERGAPKCRRACVGFIQMGVKSSACGGICAEFCINVHVQV